MSARLFILIKQHVPTLMLVLVVLHSTAWVLMWQWQQQHATWSASREMSASRNDLTSITLHRMYFEQIKIKKHEIILNGRLYDFKNLQPTGDSVMLELYHDRHEEKLYAMLHRFFSGRQSGNGLIPSWLTHCLFTPFELLEVSLNLNTPVTVSDNAPTCFWTQHLLPQNRPGCLFSPPDFG